ncbi:hypothetical protein BB559_006926 [Furculomyces boomerangus]|uniref:C3HC-type domain-containing protein n=1 Tax=Furculomyces boomerangus TaxID=61424 RepID=A0A2T9XZR8_9FUNG|nr:hypothetical protein BB559_006926 [Furculomyces boomerangus]
MDKKSFASSHTLKKRLFDALEGLDSYIVLDSKRSHFDPKQSEIPYSNVLAFKPWSKLDLGLRIKSFKINSQTINPLTCAKRGWINIDKNKIECCVCKARLIIDPLDFDVVSFIESKWFDQLSNAHHSGCKWRNVVCKDEVYTPELITFRTRTKRVNKSIDILKENLDQIPIVYEPQNVFTNDTFSNMNENANGNQIASDLKVSELEISAETNTSSNKPSNKESTVDKKRMEDEEIDKKTSGFMAIHSFNKKSKR